MQYYTFISLIMFSFTHTFIMDTLKPFFFFLLNMASDHSHWQFLLPAFFPVCRSYFVSFMPCNLFAENFTFYIIYCSILHIGSPLHGLLFLLFIYLVTLWITLVKASNVTL